MNQVNQMAHKDLASFLQTTKIMFEIFEEVAVNIAPAFGGGMMEIRTPEDMANLEAKFS